MPYVEYLFIEILTVHLLDKSLQRASIITKHYLFPKDSNFSPTEMKVEGGQNQQAAVLCHKPELQGFLQPPCKNLVSYRQNQRQ